jgi:exonuclease III
MKLISWNVNGIRAAVKNGFGNFLKEAQPDILGLQEIKIDSDTRAKTELTLPTMTNIGIRLSGLVTAAPSLWRK